MWKLKQQVFFYPQKMEIIHSPTSHPEEPTQTRRERSNPTQKGLSSTEPSCRPQIDCDE